MTIALSFDANYYLTARPDVFNAFVATAGATGLTWAAFAESHYNTFGRFEGSNPNSVFNTTEYLTANPDVAAAGVNPFQHFLSNGITEGRAPNATVPGAATFDSAAYLAANADLGAAGITTAEAAYAHYLEFGQFEGRPGTPVVTTPGSSFTLTTGIDAGAAFTGTVNNDTFFATETTLSSADALDGAGGSDTLRYASSGNAAVNEAGFTAVNIENVEITSDAVGGTTFDVTGVSNVVLVTNTNSSNDLTLIGGGNVVDVLMTSVSGGNTNVQYKAATIAGAADVQNLTLNGVESNAAAAVSSFTANGIESLNVMTTGAASQLTALTTGAATVTVTGDQNLSVNGALVGATAIDANAFTGNLSVVADSAAANVVATGGTGMDMVNFSSGFTAGDSFDGGDGIDTIGLTQAVASGALGGALSNVETLSVTDAGTGIIDMDNFAGVTTVNYDGGIAAAATATVDDAVSGITVGADMGVNGTGALVVDLKVDDVADEATINLNSVGTADTFGTVNADDAETLTINVNDDAAVAGTGTLALGTLAANDAKSVVINAAANLTIAAATSAGITSLDASASTGTLGLVGLDFAAAGAEIKLGAGADTFGSATTGATGLGADTITLGAGADKIFYTAINQSSGAKVDTITDFLAGVDDIDVSALGILSTSQFVGTFANFGAAQGAVNNVGAIEAVFQADTNTLWVDVNNDGTLNSNDLQVILTGVTSLAATDLNMAGVGNTVNLTAPAAVVNLTTMTNADAMTTNEDDTIQSLIANLVGSTVVGGAGTDTLKMLDTGAVAPGALITGVETLVLADGTNNVTLNAAGAFTNVTGGTGNDTVNDGNLVAGGTVALAGGSDVYNLTGNSIGTTIDLGDGDDSVVSTFGGIITSTLTGGAGTDTLSLATGDDIKGATVSGFENLTLAGGASVTMTVAQNNAFTGAVVAGGAEQITLSDAGTITGLANVETYVLANGTNTLTVDAGVAAPVVTGNAGADTVNVTSAQADNASAIALAGGADILNITGGITGAHALTGDTGIETVNISGASTANTLTVVDANGVTTINASAITGGGVSLDISGLTTAVADTAVTLTSGNDTLATGIDMSGNNDMSISFGQGSDTVVDIATVGTGMLTFNIATSGAGNVDVKTIAATTVDLGTGGGEQNATISIDGLNIGALATSLAASQLGGITNTAVVTNDGVNSLITMDLNHNGVIDAGSDFQVSIMGQILTTADFNVAGGDLVFA